MKTNYIGNFEYLRIDENTDLQIAKEQYDAKKCRLFLSGKFDDSFLTLFAVIFNDISQLLIQNEIKSSNDFLYSFQKLQILQISTLFSEIDFSRVAKLKELRIQWNKGYIINLYDQKSLKHLFISYLHEKDLNGIGDLVNLNTLSIKDVKCTTLAGIEKLINLKALYIAGAKELIDISALSRLSTLEYIEFDSCSKLADFTQLSSLSNLKALQITDSKKLLSISFITQMRKLRQLILSGSTVVNDYDLSPARHIDTVFAQNKKYNINLDRSNESNTMSFSDYL